VDEALRAYTWAGAYAGFDDAARGTLERGKLADLVLIDRDLTRVAPETIRDARVLLTVVGGRVVYERAAATAGAAP
jgi:predicted amidohydrolase YtcJ